MMNVVFLSFILGVTALDAASILLKGSIDPPQDQGRLVEAFEKLGTEAGEVVLDGGIWIVRKEVRLPSNLVVRATSNAVLRLPAPRLVTKTVPIGARLITVNGATEFRAGGELAVLPPDSKERITTVRIAAIYLGRNCIMDLIIRNTVEGKIEADRKLNELTVLSPSRISSFDWQSKNNRKSSTASRSLDSWDFKW